MAKVLSINVRGLRDRAKRMSVFSFLKSQDFTVCFLQEVHLKDSRDVASFANEWVKGPSRWSVGGVHSSGVGVLFGTHELVVEGCEVGVAGRLMSVDVCMGECSFRFLGVYAPAVASQRTTFLANLAPFCLTNRKVIIGGDFNLDLADKDHPDVRFIHRMLGQYGLVDCVARATKGKTGPTWRNSRGQSRRLDYVFSSRGLVVESASISPFWHSDHDLVRVEIAGSGSKFGKGCWRLNTEVLEEAAYRTLIKRELEKLWVERSEQSSLLRWWDMVKRRIQRVTRAYCTERQVQEKKEGRLLQERLTLLYENCNKGMAVDFEDINRQKEQLRSFYETRARRYLFKAHIDNLQFKETCSSFQFRSMKERQCKRVVEGLRDGQGKIVTDKDGMLRVATDFYQELFSKQETEVAAVEHVLRSVASALTDEERAGLEGAFTVRELAVAMRGLKKGKVPGMDGLPVEFYSVFWEELKDILLLVLNEALEVGYLGTSMRTGLLILLYKKGEATDLRNWRPLTLLCADYKILAKALVNRLKQVLPAVVGKEQTCGVRGRRISWPLQLVRDVIAWSGQRDVPFMLVSLDLEKAFDRVSRGFLWRVMDRMGFGPRFIGWVRLLYREVGSKILLNGHVGGMVWQDAGVRQGCPLSPLLFVLYIEAYARLVCADPKIEGVLVPGSGGERARIALYADDVTLFMASDVDLQGALNHLVVFAKASGAKLNRGKSHIKFFGRWRDRQDGVGGLQVCRGPLKILGVHFKEGDAANYNWLERLEKVRLRLGSWKNKGLTYVGKALIIKIEVLALLGYLASVYPMPLRLNRYLTREVFWFMWGKKYEYIGRVDMCRPIEEGGRGVPSLPTKLSCFFVSSLCAASKKPVEHVGVYFVRFWLAGRLRGVFEWDNKAPHGEDMPWHYRQAYRWIGKYAQGLEGRVLSDHRALYGTVMASSTVDLVGGLPKDVWSRIQPRGLQHDLMDLNWFIAWRRLPVREVLHRHKLTLQMHCPRATCNHLESIRHVFWDCVYAGRVWAKCSLLFGMIALNFALTLNVVLYGLKTDVYPRETIWALWVLMSHVKLELWKARNGLVKNGVQLSVTGLYNRLLYRVKCEIILDIRKRGLHAAKERWKGLLVHCMS